MMMQSTRKLRQLQKLREVNEPLTSKMAKAESEITTELNNL